MANIIDKFLNSMKLNDEDDYEDEGPDPVIDDPDPYPEEPEEPVKPREKARMFRKNPKPVPEEDDAYTKEPSYSRRSSDNVVPLRRQTASSLHTGMEVCMMKPSSFDESMEICEMLLSGRAVVINMEGVNIDLAQRIIDFTSGACYSMNGKLKMISSFIFIASPNSIELSGDFREKLNLDETGQMI